MWLLSALTLLLARYCFAAPQVPDLSDPKYLNSINTVFGSQPLNGSNALNLWAQKPDLSDPKYLNIIDTVFGSKPLNGSNVLSLRIQEPDLSDPKYLNIITAVFGRQPLNADHDPPANQSGCVCVPYYQCTNDSEIFTGAEFNVNMRLQGSCEDRLERCCKAPNTAADLSNLPALTARSGCGGRNTQGIHLRITDATNNEAQFAEFPWMVAILNGQKFNPNNPKPFNITYLAGGSLIHPRAILTGAHRILGKQPSELVVRAGEWDTLTRAEPYPHQERNVKKIIIHEQFNRISLVNDTAILILSRPFFIAPNVDVVCLPYPDDRFDFSRCFASGWGKDMFGVEGRHQTILKKVELPIVPNYQCQSALGLARLGPYFVLDPSFICAGGEAGIDTCNGDGGGPLVCPLQHDPNRYVEAGIVSWGLGCGSAAVPAAYVNVAGARTWIDQKMANNNLETSAYTYTRSV